PSAFRQRLIPGLRLAACPPASRAGLAAARGEDDANRRRQRRERVPPGYPKGMTRLPSMVIDSSRIRKALRLSESPGWAVH
ncbi:hypothetical protein, partial [Candidatus Entotheonella palauensis]|uniref:hypothetical protein n=1 Tax=Candidatus Entotheonella palauensis TaxID=93172 RepID=UPI0015C44BF2